MTHELMHGAFRGTQVEKLTVDSFIKRIMLSAVYMVERRPLYVSASAPPQVQGRTGGGIPKTCGIKFANTSRGEINTAGIAHARRTGVRMPHQKQPQPTFYGRRTSRKGAERTKSHLQHVASLLEAVAKGLQFRNRGSDRGTYEQFSLTLQAEATVFVRCNSIFAINKI